MADLLIKVFRSEVGILEFMRVSGISQTCGCLTKHTVCDTTRGIFLGSSTDTLYASTSGDVLDVAISGDILYVRVKGDILSVGASRLILYVGVLL